jgi:hypothetical protein
VLVLTSPAESEDFDDCVTFKDFIINNAETLYMYANSKRKLGQGESLYFVTGCDKSKSWAIAAYLEAMEPPKNVLHLQWDGTEYDWIDQGTAHVCTGSTSITENEVNDQCLFLRGYKLSFSQRFRDRMLKVGSGLSLDMEHDGPSNSKSPNTGNRGTGGSTHNHNSNSSTGADGRMGGSSSGTQLSDAAAEEFTIASFPDPDSRLNVSRKLFPQKQHRLRGHQLSVHPCDQINKILLEQVSWRRSLNFAI